MTDTALDHLQELEDNAVSELTEPTEPTAAEVLEAKVGAHAQQYGELLLSVLLRTGSALVAGLPQVNGPAAQAFQAKK